MKRAQLLLLTLSFAGLAGCGVQSLPQAKNKVEASEAEIVNQYKRRADLIPNLVETVKGYAKQERETLEAVTEARAKATQTTVNADDPESVKQFQAAQSQLGSALSRLMVVVEKYPDLKSNQNFLALQAQLEGTENRITIARQRLIEDINQYNNLVTVPPTSWTNSLFYKLEKLPQWTAENAQQIKEAPSVKF
jgi:LemA protein